MASATAELDHLTDWIGRSQTARQRIDAWPVQAMSATLDRDDPPAEDGMALPPGWHWMLFNPTAPAREIGADGHPKRGGFLPPVPLPRRMWAGGRLSFQRPLVIGSAVERQSRIDGVKIKHGRSGRLVFVTVRHVIADADGPCIEEAQDIVFRDPPDSSAPAQPVAAPESGPWRRAIVPDPVLLFRYSALTFNGHRIHYDQPYVTGVEGYPGLIVHGPLIATLLLDLVRRQAPERRLARFSFRAVSPLFDIAPFTVNGVPDGDGAKLWAANDAGGLAMDGAVEFAP
jgi:3-methylfumaryl-CoA hydratase